MDRTEVGFDLARFGLACSRELGEDRLFQGVSGAEATCFFCPLTVIVSMNVAPCAPSLTSDS